MCACSIYNEKKSFRAEITMGKNSGGGGSGDKGGALHGTAQGSSELHMGADGWLELRSSEGKAGHEEATPIKATLI